MLPGRRPARAGVRLERPRSEGAWNGLAWRGDGISAFAAARLGSSYRPRPFYRVAHLRPSQLCRYVLRPPLAEERLWRRPDDERIALEVTAAASDGRGTEGCSLLRAIPLRFGRKFSRHAPLIHLDP